MSKSFEENLAAILNGNKTDTASTTKSANAAKINPAYDKLFAAEGGSIDNLLAELYR